MWKTTVKQQHSLSHTFVTCSLLFPLLYLGFSVTAAADLHHNDQLSVYGDFRLRLESDFYSKDAAAIKRNDRDV